MVRKINALNISKEILLENQNIIIKMIDKQVIAKRHYYPLHKYKMNVIIKNNFI